MISFKSGVPSFERVVLGLPSGTGCLPLGQVMLLEKDLPHSSANYGSTLARCFASSVIHDHLKQPDKKRVAYVGPDANFFVNCPQQVVTNISTPKAFADNDPLKIAFRYQHLGLTDKSAVGTNYMDLSSKVAPEVIDRLKSEGILLQVPMADLALVSSDDLWNTLIILDDFLCPEWLIAQPLEACLKQLVLLKNRLSHAAVLITVPSKTPHLSLLLSASDVAVKLVNDAISAPPLRDGFAHVLIPPSSCSGSGASFKRLVPPVKSVSFQCRVRRQYEFEPFHLPPDLSSPLDSSCSKRLDF
jgi:hypothetical protein